MMLDRRITLRCLTEDLSADWENASHHRSALGLRVLIRKNLADEATDAEVAAQLRSMPPLNALRHPLIRQFSDSFGPEADLSKKESISGLSEPHWWKQKTMQWRGASTDHSTVGTEMVWLCAAGLRREGSGTDFYAAFMRSIERSGANPWLTTEEDRIVIKVDQKVLALDAWKLQIHCSALALLAEALSHPGETRTVKFAAPSLATKKSDAGPSVGEMTMSLESVDVEGEELWEVFLTATVLDRTKVVSVDLACQIARAALQSDAEEWSSTVYLNDSYAFSALLDPSARVHAEGLVRTGTLPAESTPGALRIGLRAHYARKHGLVDAQVEGSSVLSLCGYWFVPTADHAEVDTCPECQKRINQIV